MFLSQLQGAGAAVGYIQNKLINYITHKQYNKNSPVADADLAAKDMKIHYVISEKPSFVIF